MRRKQSSSGLFVIVIAVAIVIFALPHLQAPEPEMASAAVCSSATPMMDSYGKAVSGSILPITPCCVFDSQVTSCEGGYPYDGVLFIADIANTGSVDVSAKIEEVIVTPVDKDNDAELARRVFMSFQEEAYVMREFFVRGSDYVSLDFGGVYKGSSTNQLVPSGGQALWYTLISRNGPPNGGLTPGNVIIDYKVCAKDVSGRFKETCADQTPFLLTVDENGNMYLTRWTGAV